MNVLLARTSVKACALVAMLVISCGAATSLGQADAPAAAPAAAAAAQDTRQVTLSPRLIRKSVAGFVVSEKINGTMKSKALMGGQVQQLLEREVTIRLEVLDVKADHALVQLRYMRIKTGSESKAGEEVVNTDRFDSTTPAADDGENPFAPVLRPLIGAPIELRIGVGGQIESVTSAPELRTVDSPASGIIGLFLDSEPLEKFIGEVFTMYHPEGAATVGETWNHEELSEPAVADSPAIATTSQYRLERYELPVATVRTTRTARLEHPPEQAKPVKTELKTYSGAGTLEWDTDMGMLRSLDYQEEIVVQIQPAADQSVEYSSKGTRTIKPAPVQ